MKTYQIECDPDCGFLVRSHERDEAVDLAMHHARMIHPDSRTSEAEMIGNLRVSDPGAAPQTTVPSR